MNKTEKLSFFKNLMSFNYDINHSIYNNKMLLQGCENNSLLLEKVMESKGLKKMIYNYSKENDMPIIIDLSSKLGLVCSAILEKEEHQLRRIHIIGPVITSDISQGYIVKTINRYDINLQWKRQFLVTLSNLPIVPIINITDYTIMCHYAINNQKITRSDIKTQFKGITNTPVLQEKSIGVIEVNNVSKKMYENFINYVHELKQVGNLTKPIIGICDYINLHILDKFTIDDIATYVGYSKYYLTRKFAKEMGYSITQYINKKKIEKSKTLLITTTDTIDEISEDLHFCSRHYFSKLFKKETGMTPAKYRDKNMLV